MRRITLLLRFFALLDVITLYLLSTQAPDIAAALQNPAATDLSLVRVSLTLLVYLLLIFSAAGQFMVKKYGLIIYYVQFPLRLVVFVFSFGFLTLISQYSDSISLFEWLFRIAIVLEFFRLYFTVQVHRQLFR